MAAQHVHTDTAVGCDFEDNFQLFFEQWKHKQKQLLHQLIPASEQLAGSSESSPPPPMDPSCMVLEVVQLHEEYYRAKSKWADKNVLLILSPSWTSSLEDAFLWIGGWRPTMAIQLLYSKSGLQLKAKLDELFQGIANASNDLADLMPGQLSQVDELHMSILREEKEITEKMAKQQERATSVDMVELSQLVTDAMRDEGTGARQRDRKAEEERVKSTLSPKEEGFRKILAKADNLRLKTLKSVIEVLSPLQAMHFLIAATELQLRLHEWGMAKDERQLG